MPHTISMKDSNGIINRIIVCERCGGHYFEQFSVKQTCCGDCMRMDRMEALFDRFDSAINRFIDALGVLVTLK